MKCKVKDIHAENFHYFALAFVCPGCKSLFGEGLHLLTINSVLKQPSWEWNGDLEKPTLSPSILTKMGVDENGKERVCHSFLVDGKFNFLDDCTHLYAGQKGIEMPDLPDWVVNEE